LIRRSFPPDTPAPVASRPGELRTSGFGTTLFDALAPPPAPAAPTSDSVFDVCHVGVVLRALLFVHGVLAIGALFVAPTWASWLVAFATGSSAALPAVLVWLLVACAARRPFGALPVAGQWAVAVGLGALGLIHRDIAVTFAPLVAHLHIDPEGRYLGRALRALWALDDRALKRISAGTFFYATLLLIEGVGLLWRRRWAEYFTVVVTGSFIPFELDELARRFTATRVVIIGVNVAVVWYLIHHLRHRAG
jgi:uncharacterized membrane protein (DUF2068 family)